MDDSHEPKQQHTQQHTEQCTSLHFSINLLCYRNWSHTTRWNVINSVVGFWISQTIPSLSLISFISRMKRGFICKGMWTPKIFGRGPPLTSTYLQKSRFHRKSTFGAPFQAPKLLLLFRLHHQCGALSRTATRFHLSVGRHRKDPYFQQDGEWAHTAASSIEFLGPSFDAHLISLNSCLGTVWSPRSPDLSPFDFFL